MPRSAASVSIDAVRRFLPILGWLGGYDRRWLAADALAGLSVWALLVPQSLAYATLSGVPVQYGLYTAFAALLAYPIFGTSRHLAEGPSAAVCAVCAAAITPLAGAAAMGTNAAAPFAAALALTTGIVYVALGVLKMGWVSTFLSKAVMAGFVLGFSIGIIIDQSHKLFGVEGGSGSYAEELWATIKQLPDTSAMTLLVGGGSLALLLLLRRLVPKWPRALIVMALTIVAASTFDLADHGVAVTGDIPTGLFSVGIPHVDASDLGALVLGALAVVFVGYSESLAAARAMAARHGYEIDANQELIAQGMANGAAGLVGGFPVDGSLSKSSVADAAGQRTQTASLIDAGFVLLTLLFLADLFEQLPSATLAAVVIDAMLGLITFAEMRRYFVVSRSDFVFFSGAMFGILFFGIIAGILIGVVLSLLLLIARSSRTSVRPLGRKPASDVFHALGDQPDLETTPGVVVVRVDGPLFFADADHFRARVRDLSRADDVPTTTVVVDAESVFLTDTDGADILKQLAGELNARGIALVLARAHPDSLALWERAGVVETLGAANVHPTVAHAVEAARSRRPEADPAGDAVRST
jgi:high affinity sulfate transporter 1